MEPEHSRWDLRVSGPEGLGATVLCLLGGLCTAAFYEDLMVEPALAGVRMVAATLPGQGGTPALGGLSVESYAHLAGGLAADFGCDAVVGQSLERGAPVYELVGLLSHADLFKRPRVRGQARGVGWHQ